MCEFSDRLVAWLDGELPVDESAAIESHLGGCSDCRARMSAYEETSAAFTAYRDAVARERMNRPRSAHPWLPIAGALAAALAIFLIALGHPAADETPRPLANARGSEMPKPSRDRKEA